MKESAKLNIPRHIAIIMDGNGRWAQKRGEQRIYGHIKGVDSVRRVIRECVRLGVGYLTLYVFSTENWNRPQMEVDGLMELLCDSVISEMPELVENGVRVRVVGEKETMSEKVQQHLQKIELGTEKGKHLVVQLALNYGSREEIVCAVKKIAEAAIKGEMGVEDITAQYFENQLYTSGAPNPDLMIRTSGELRISNFLLWQMAYTEFYFTPTLWPDFDEKELQLAIEEYTQRERRYGGV